MRKNLIAMSAAAFVGGLGMAGGAAANVLLDIAPTASNATAQAVIAGGIGHQLIIPYYNVQSGNATLFNLVNTDTVNGKAVKVRFRGASNSDDVFDFQVYLSPTDMWTATLTRGADGRTVLTTTDRSCTIPAAISGTSFVTARLPQTFSADNLARETREGYIEMFNMADIPARTGTDNFLFRATKHVNGVAPCSGGATALETTENAFAISQLQFDPIDITAARQLGFRAPTTGLFANFTIINVPKSGASSGEALAIAALDATGANGRGNIVFFPQVGGGVANVDFFTADPALRTSTAGATGVQNGAGAPFTGVVPIVAASQFDLPDLSTPYLSNAGFPLTAAAPIAQAEALTRATAVTSVINEFLGDTSISANTDWVFSLPLRRYSVALDYRPLSTSPPTAPLRAFTKFLARDYFTGANTTVNAARTQICVTTEGVSFYDREEGFFVGSSFVISPNPPIALFTLCGEGSVLGFNAVAGASVLGAEVAFTNFPTQGSAGIVRDGWARVGTAGVATGAAPAVGGNGLPVVGKSYIRASNPAVAAGIAANFGVSYEHRYTRPSTP